MCGARTVRSEPLCCFTIGEKEHGDCCQPHDASVARRVRIVRPAEGVAGLAKPAQRDGHSIADVEAPACAAQVFAIGPRTVPFHLVNWVEAAALDQAGRQAQRHRRIIGSLAGAELAGAAADHIG